MFDDWMERYEYIIQQKPSVDQRWIQNR
jgi:hypothetical protein